MDQKDSCSVFDYAGFAGDNAPRAVFSSLVCRPMMFDITAVMYPKDSCDMVPMFDCRKLRRLRSCRSSKSLSFRRGRSPWSRPFRRPLRLPSCCSISDGRCPVVHFVQVHFPVVAQRWFPMVQTARRTIETSQLQYASDRRCPCCAGLAASWWCPDMQHDARSQLLVRPCTQVHGHCRQPSLGRGRGGGDAGSLLPGVLPPN